MNIKEGRTMAKTDKGKALSARAKAEDKERIEAYIDQMKLDDPVSAEEFRKVVRALIGARGLFVYYIWKVLKEKGLDADALVREACTRWGVSVGKKLGEIKTPAEFFDETVNENRSVGMEQEFTLLNDERAAKEFYYCPHMAAAEEAGATREEKAALCKDMLCHGDYGTASLHPVHLEWPEPTLGEGGQRCVMMLTPKRK